MRPQLRIALRGGKAKNDIPSWARDATPRIGEKPIQFVRRVCEENGQSTKEGPGTAMNKLKKYAETHFRPDGEPLSLFDKFLNLFDNDEIEFPGGLYSI